LKVFFDFYEIALGKGKSIGIYNYALAVLQTLADKNSSELEIIVACSGENYDEIKGIPNLKVEVVSAAYPNFKQRLLWRLTNAIRLAKKEKADIYYSPKGFAPGLFKRRRKPFIVLTIHDMIPFYYLYNFPNYFSFFENHFVTQSLKHSLTVANQVITISDYSMQMMHKFHKRRSGINVIYNGVSIDEKNLKVKRTPSYIFAISSKLPHKNMKNLILGYIEYRKLTSSPLPLIICGIEDAALNSFEQYKPFIKCTAFADKNQFASLFSNASLFLFLPKIEGFGFPPLESLMYGVPTVVSDIPVLREVLGESAYFVDVVNPKKIAHGIIEVLSDSKIAFDIIANGEKIILQYTWEKCCNQILNVFKETINENNY
jgi:glycosyltransferase involved in cell wall biosynthesis